MAEPRESNRRSRGSKKNLGPLVATPAAATAGPAITRCREAQLLLFAFALSNERQHGWSQKSEGDERCADRAQNDAEPHEGGDSSDDRGRSQDDRDLGEPASELIVSEPAIG
jgi:hypothetical protein